MAKRLGQLRDVWLGPSVTEENEPECQLKVANTKDFICGLRGSGPLGMCACIGMRIGIWMASVLRYLMGYASVQGQDHAMPA